MSQAHLAEAAGVSERTVRRAERGLPMSDEVMRALCSVLGVGIGDLQPVTDQFPTRAGPSTSSFSPMSRSELALRSFLRSVTAPVGGLHPWIVFVCMVVMGFCYGPPIVKLSVIWIPLGAMIVMYFEARRDGRTNSEAIDYVRGRRFRDGQLVRLEERRMAMFEREMATS